MGREVEVTPEMIAVGVREFSLQVDASYQSPPHLGQVLAAVYIAMACCIGRETISSSSRPTEPHT